MDILLTAHATLSDAIPLNFHHLSMCPMALLEERPEDVLDACQPELQVDLVAALNAASASPESKI
jgi:hypothetical protein